MVQRLMTEQHLESLMQNCINSIINALELRKSCEITYPFPNFKGAGIEV